MLYVLSIIGIIAIVWISLLIIAHIIESIVFRFTANSKYICVTRDSAIYPTDNNEWYIIPSICFRLEFNEPAYPSFEFTWLKWRFYISYHFKTEEEEEIEAEIRKKLI